MCAHGAPSAKRSSTVQSRGALLNEVVWYINEAHAATRGAGGDRRTSDSKEKEEGKTKTNQPVSIYSSTWVGSIPYFFTINRVKLGLGTVMLFGGSG